MHNAKIARHMARIAETLQLLHDTNCQYIILTLCSVQMFSTAYPVSRQEYHTQLRQQLTKFKVHEY